MKYSNKLFVLKKIIDYFQSRNPSKEIGRTKIQKLMFFINQRVNLGLEFSLYHYGPYSYEVASLIEFAVSEGLIVEEWNGAVGYKILPTERLEELVPDEEFRDDLDGIISEYENYNVKELSIIATGLLVKEQMGLASDLIPKKVHQLKPKYDLEEIDSLLSKHI